MVWRTQPRLRAMGPRQVGLGSAARIIEGLPNRTILQTAQIWQNAITALASPDKRWLHEDAKKVVASVKLDWDRRSRLPHEPAEYFRWPTTDAPFGSGQISTDGWPSEGMLSFLGYRVGKEGKPLPERHLILAFAFDSVLPPAFPLYYLSQWSRPSSSSRLRKMAESIASFARNAKRRDTMLLDQAIVDWELDLAHLYHKYYVGRFYFAFQTTSLN